MGPLWRAERGARASSSPAGRGATIGLALPALGSGRASSGAAAAVAAAPTISGVELWLAALSWRGSVADFFVVSTPALSVHAALPASADPGGQAQARRAWLWTSRSSTTSGSSRGSLALTLSVKRRMAWRELLVQVLLMSPS